MRALDPPGRSRANTCVPAFSRNAPRSPENLNTNSLTGQSSCDYVAAGYLWSAALNSPQPCPVDTFAAAPRAVGADAGTCTPWWAPERARWEAPRLLDPPQHGAALSDSLPAAGGPLTSHVALAPPPSPPQRAAAHH